MESNESVAKREHIGERIEHPYRGCWWSAETGRASFVHRTLYKCARTFKHRGVVAPRQLPGKGTGLEPAIRLGGPRAAVRSCAAATEQTRHTRPAAGATVVREPRLLGPNRVGRLPESAGGFPPVLNPLGPLVFIARPVASPAVNRGHAPMHAVAYRVRRATTPGTRATARK